MGKGQNQSLKTVSQFHDPEAPWIILFHGYGADAHDLSSLADVVPLTKTCNWLFPNGPIEVPIGPGWTGSAWWNLDIEKIQREAQMGLSRSMSEESPAELPLVREKVFKMISDLKVPWNKIILGGFSQGGMLATDIALHAPEQPAGLVILSSGLINKKIWTEQANKNKMLSSQKFESEMNSSSTEQIKPLKFYQSHGQQDSVISIKNAQQMNEFFRGTCGMQGNFRQFQGGHEIPPLVIQEMGAFISNTILLNK